MTGRIPIEDVTPSVACGRYPAKAVVGELVPVSAVSYREGHDALGCNVVWRGPDGAERPFTRMRPGEPGLAQFHAVIKPDTIGRWTFTVEAFDDPYGTWRNAVTKKIAAGQGVEDLANDLAEGADILDEATKIVPVEDQDRVRAAAAALREEQLPLFERVAAGLDLHELLWEYPVRRLVTSTRSYAIWVDRPRALFSAWYEFFPRSEGAEVAADGTPIRHGTFATATHRLPAVAAMGFDVLYLPPIHPIGEVNRKGPNNTLTPGPEDTGSPWAIGSKDGGHDAIHPDLGTFDDFDDFVARAGELGMEVALDLAFQCSPDHPYVKDHPEWFKKRPDGTIQYAENPPKKYQDIYPIDFETEQWQDLWAELKRVVVYWVEQGVRIFRVDNPHTKAFPFWEWLIGEIKRDYPDVLFLSEAFTRPKVMYRLAKLGFTQSYTYFAWRTSKAELTEYLTELTGTEVREYFRPNFWPNTPDILTEQLQHGGRATFMSRLVLAATLGASYGIYGPAYELCEHRAIRPGSEEYLDSEKYEIRHWPIDRSDSLREFIGLVNRARRSNPALQRDDCLDFHRVDNEYLIAYSKHTEDRSNVILVVVNLSPHHVHAGWIDLDLDALGLKPDQPFQVHDLLTNAYYLWAGSRNYVVIDPQSAPAQIFAVRARLRTEQDFDYYL